MNRVRHHVLVIEDNPHDARLIEIMLASARAVRFEVDTVDRLQLAQQWLEDHDPDVILLDLSLPDSHGIETFETLSTWRSDIPIVVLSGLHDEQLALRAVQAGAQDYLVKSQDSDDAMVRAVHYAIERFRGGRTLRQREEHLRLLTDQLPCVFWTTDSQLRFRSFSGTGLPNKRVRADDVEGRYLDEFSNAEEIDAEFFEIHQAAAQGASKTLDIHWADQVYHVHVEPFRHRDGRIAGTIGVALDVTDQKLIDFELRLTRQIQEGLRPQRSPRVDGFDIAGCSQSAAAAGGDYFDYFPVCDGTTGVVVCDVAGHGLGPAMMMCQTRAYVRALAVHYHDPCAILRQANQFLCHDTSEERLVALFLAKIRSADRVLQYANAGHRGYLLRPGSAPELLKPNGIPLNVVEEYQLEPAELVRMQPGDLVLLYTDGVIECTSVAGEPFGQDRMLEFVAQRADASAREIVDRLFEEVGRFIPEGCVEDDMTAVIVRAC
jgi:serine phosphatase RsbU (regulator of sigma subunit)/CheY-like chemotaxis protein